MKDFYTIVIADDEEQLRHSLIRRIPWEEVGFQVVGEAENGIEALEQVERLEPDLLLTDIRMPFMSGIELAREAREICPTMQIAFLSGHDDFSYAQQAIQYNIISYMLKPISSAELTEELRRIKGKIDQRFEEFASSREQEEHGRQQEFLQPLILDAYQSSLPEREEELLKAAKNSGFLEGDTSSLQYAVLVISLEDADGRNCTAQASVHAMDTIYAKYIHYYGSFFCSDRVVSLLATTKQGMDKYLHIIVEEISQSVRRIMGRKACIGVSRAVTSLSQCHEAYGEAMDAMSYARRSRNGAYFIADIERSDKMDHEAVQNELSQLEGLLRAGSEEELRNFLNQVFDWMEQEKVSPMGVQFILIQMIASAFRVLYALADGEAVRRLQDSFPLQMQALHEAHHMRPRLMDFFLGAQKLILEQRKKSGSVICDQALSIIEERYMDPDLSLVVISSEIAVSPNYLSALIKKSTGSTFIDLLTRRRIETAKELVIGTSMKVKEISERCGYNDQHYFSYCFKKYTGLSPGACRRQYEEQQS